MKGGIAESELPLHTPLRKKSREVFVTKDELKRITDYLFSIDKEYHTYFVAFAFLQGQGTPQRLTGSNGEMLILMKGL